MEAVNDLWCKSCYCSFPNLNEMYMYMHIVLSLELGGHINES